MLVETLGRNVVGGYAENRQVNGLLGLMGAGDAVGQAFQAIERRDFQAAVFQLMLQGLARQFVVFQYRHTVAQQWCAGQVFNVVAGFGQVQADPELRAFTRRAVYTDFTAHLLDQALGNHQAQPGAARLARQRVIGLAERLEQRAYILAGQADAGVLHADAQLHAVFLFFFNHRPGDDSALAGELDRVADQVGQDLLEPQRVAHQRQRRVAVDQADQFQLLGMGGGREDGQGVLQQVAQVERDAVEYQFAGFDLREVEDLIDDAQQVVSRFFDGTQVVQLARRELAFLQQVGKAEDAVERRADFMAHIGQELGLDTAGLQRLFARQVQLDVLDFDGFQILAHVFGGLVDAVLQFFLGVLQGFGHAVDA